jgi:hypothetical protein
MGRFDRRADRIGQGLAGPGRPKGAKNKTTLALKEAILSALDKVGGDEYLAKLAIENSSAFASLLGRVLPATLTAASESDGGGGITFERIIVMPNGHRHIEGKTPLQIAPPASHALPSDDSSTQHDRNTLEEDGQDQLFK